jgi:hypothetical protein
MAELETVSPVLVKEYLRYSPQPWVPEPSPPEAMVLSPQRWITPVVVDAAADVVVEEEAVQGRHWL